MGRRRRYIQTRKDRTNEGKFPLSKDPEQQARYHPDKEYNRSGQFGETDADGNRHTKPRQV